MTVNEKMTSLAHQVRRISNTPTTELLSIDEMVEKMSSMTGLSEIDRNSLLKKIIERTITEITADDLAGVMSIGSRAFAFCKSLVKVTLPDTILNIFSSGFNECIKLAEVNLNTSLSNIDADAFYNCISLEEIFIPDNVSWIGAYAFGGCKNLKRVTWTAKGCGLVNGCFSGCTSLEYIDFSRCGDKVATLESLGVLGGVPNTCKFYVRADKLSDWKSAPNWSHFADRIMVKPPASAYFVNNAGDSWAFQFEDGMTWAEAFAHPTYSASIEAVGHGVYISNDSEGNSNVYIGYSGDSYLCSANDKIISGHQYPLHY